MSGFDKYPLLINIRFLYSSGNFIGTQTAGAYMNSFDRTAIYDLNFFNIGLPPTVSAARNLTAGDAYPMSRAYRFSANIAFCHTIRLLHRNGLQYNMLTISAQGANNFDWGK
jgi:hypothetical protein